MREPVTWDRGGDPVGIAAVVHPGWVQRALTAEGWRGFPGNEPGGGEGFSKVERIAQQIFDKLAELHITYVHEPAESVPEAQRVRAVDEVLSLGQATCLDMCAAFCSAALDAGIYPLLLTVRQEEHRRHALVLVPLDLRWSFGVPTLLDEGFSRSPLIIDGDDVRDLVANAPDDAMGTWLAIDVEQATYLADRDAGDWACAIASGASYVKEWDWDVCVDVGGIRAQQDNSSELPTLARTEKVLAPGYLPLPDDSTPLQMIRTRYGVVPFCSRPEYRELREWAVGTAKSSGRRPDVSVAVLTGAGGVGKTRMAAQLCHDLEVLGWYTGFAPAKSAMKNDELTYLAELTTELLIVVDYAEESRQEQLVALLRALRGRRSPTRIVLTARGIDSWWEDFCEDLESDGTQLGQVLVKQLEPRPDPVLLYRQAVRGFSKVINGVNPPEVAIPEHAGDTALDIVLQAWLAVVDNGGMQDPQPERSVEKGARSARASNPNARDSLYDRVLRLEFKRWRAFPELQDISLKHLRRIAATLSLLAPDAGQVDDVLSRLPEWRGEHLRRSKFAELLSTTLLRYAGDGGVSLRPDPVAEHLILSVFGDEPEQLDAVLPGEPLEVPGISEPDASEATVTRAIMLRQQAQNLSQVITRAASQDQESATALAQHILKVCPHLWSSALEVALAQGGPFVDALENLIESGTELPFEEIEVSIPLGHSALRGVALAATQRMEAPSERDPVERAHYLHNLANRLSDVGCSGEALEVAQEAVALYRDLAQAYTPNLAASLGSLAYILADVGCSGEALEAAQEAVGLYRALVQGAPAVYTSALALSLSNLVKFLADVGCSGEALEVAQEAVGLYRDLAEVSPAAHAPELARSLSNLAYILSEVGCSGEALGVAQEAVGLYRALVQVSLAAYAPELARSLNNLATSLSEVGRLGEALEAAQEAVGLYRGLVEGSPAAYTPDLAASLNNLACFLSDVGCGSEALEVIQEAVRLRRDLVEGSPAAYTPDLAMSLSNLASILSDVGRWGEALGAAQEAVDLCRDLVEGSPAAYTPDLAMSLSNLANVLSEEGRYEEAFNVFTEGFDRFSPTIRSRLLLARATWRDDDQDKDLKEAAREADQLDDPAYLGPTRRMVVQALTAAGCDDVDLPAWATATIDESVRSSINDWLLCSDLREQAAHLKSSWSSPSKSDRDALAVEVERYVDVPAIGRLLFLVDAVMVEGVDSVVAWLNSVDCAQNLAASWYSAHTSGRGASFVRSQLREQDEDSTSGTDQPGDIDEGSRTLSNPEIRSVVLEILEANLPEDGFTELRRTLDLAEVSNADIAYAVLASDEDAEDALKELLEVARWRAMLMVPGLRPGLEEKSVHGGVAVALHAAVSEHPDQARDLLRSAYRKADPGDRTLIEVLMSKASRADDCPQEIADLCAWFRKEGSPREETGNGSPTSPS